LASTVNRQRYFLFFYLLQKNIFPPLLVLRKSYIQELDQRVRRISWHNGLISVKKRPETTLYYYAIRIYQVRDEMIKPFCHLTILICNNLWKTWKSKQMCDCFLNQINMKEKQFKSVKPWQTCNGNCYKSIKLSNMMPLIRIVLKFREISSLAWKVFTLLQYFIVPLLPYIQSTPFACLLVYLKCHIALFD